jgi:hypothetical protein
VYWEPSAKATAPIYTATTFQKSSNFTCTYLLNVNFIFFFFFSCMSNTTDPVVAAVPEPSTVPIVEDSKHTMAELPAESTPAEVAPVEAPAEAPTEAPTEAPAQAPAEAPAESTAPEAAPAEAPAEAESAPEPPAKDSAPVEAAAAEAAPTGSAPVEATLAPAAEEPKTTTAQVPSDAAAAKSEGDSKPTVTALSKLFAELESITAAAEYREMWGVELSDEQHVPSAVVLEKFLRANNKDVAKAKAQLTEALKWRKRVQPAKLLDTEFDPAKFGGLGYVTIYPKSDTHEKEILTWNIYGAVKNAKATFGNVEE